MIEFFDLDPLLESSKPFVGGIGVLSFGSPNRFGEGEQLITGGWQRYDQWAAAGRTANPDNLLYVLRP